MINNKTGLGDGMRAVVIGLCLLVAGFTHAQTAQKRVLPSVLTLYEGESKVLVAPGVDRISVGKSKMVSTTLLKNGEIVLTTEAVGETNMQVWFNDGHRESMPVIVVASNGWRQSLEIKALLGDIPGIKITTVGRRVVVDGNLEARDLARVNLVQKRYDDMLILAREITPYEQKMIYFDVKITEFDRSKTEELGINWQKDIAGPNATYQNNWVNAGAIARAYSASENGRFDEGARGVFFGIATNITSRINILEQTGSALVLASPRLSARSGGKADLTVGGEVPVVTSSISGSSVEYKDYGVMLGIEPNLDLYGNITARVNVSISQLDLAQAVGGQPAFKKRSTENDVKLRPGETLVLSGLITREEQMTYSDVKWLAKLPIIGWLFRSKSFTAGETEMVIFITPQIMENLAEGENQAMLERVNKMVEDHRAFTNKGLLD